MWSWTLTGIGVFGLYVTSTGRTWGWLVSIGLQALWATYAITTQQYGFLVAAAAYGWVFVRNYRRATSRTTHARSFGGVAE